MRTATISIDPNALNHNIEQVAKLCSQAHTNLQNGHPQNQSKPANIMVMLKANAYGHGLDVCTLALLHNGNLTNNQNNNQNVQAIGVATMEEAIQVRTLGWEKTIVLIEGVFSEQEWQTALRYEMQCVIHNQRQLDWALQSIANSDSPSNTVWLKYNTGMNRLGFSTEEIIPIAKQLDGAGYQQVLLSHFANADDKNHPLNTKQGQLFVDKLTELRQIIPSIKGSLCNSAGIINFPEWHYDWVRAGIMIYGASPVIDKTVNQLNLQAVMTLSTRIMAIHQISAGEMVGYGSRWTPKKTSYIAIISIGYGDGYPRVVDDTAFVTVVTDDSSKYPHLTSPKVGGTALSDNNADNESVSPAIICPIIGRVAMDMLVIDVSDVIDIDNIDKYLDSTVILWGNPTQIKNCPHIDEIAKSANTISYELLCRLTTRPKRQLLGARVG